MRLAIRALCLWILASTALGMSSLSNPKTPQYTDEPDPGTLSHNHEHTHTESSSIFLFEWKSPKYNPAPSGPIHIFTTPIDKAMYAAAQASQAAIAYGEPALLKREQQYASAFDGPGASFSTARSSTNSRPGSSRIAENQQQLIQNNK